MGDDDDLNVTLLLIFQLPPVTLFPHFAQRWRKIERRRERERPRKEITLAGTGPH